MAFRFYLFGPRVWGIRTGVSFNPSDLRSHKPPKIGGASYIYVIRDAEHVKIGVTKVPESRLAQIQTGSSQKIDYVFCAPASGDAYSIEREAHALLARNRLEGEWFDVSPELAIAAVTGAAAKLGQSLTAKPESPSGLADTHPFLYLSSFLFGLGGLVFLVWRFFAWVNSLPVHY